MTDVATDIIAARRTRALDSRYELRVQRAKR